MHKLLPALRRAPEPGKQALSSRRTAVISQGTSQSVTMQTRRVRTNKGMSASHETISDWPS